MGFLRILPTRNRLFLQAVALKYIRLLQRRSERLCRALDMEDYYEDAVAIAMEKMIGADIVAETDRDAYRFMCRCLANAAADERRHRSVLRIETVVVEDGKEFEPVLTIADEEEDIDGMIDSIRRMQCLNEAQAYLPKVLPTKYYRLRCDLSLFFDFQREENPLNERRFRMRRGRVLALIKGWMHRFFWETSSVASAFETQWQLGFDLAEQYLQEKETRG